MQKKGFTLVELLVVIVIISLIVLIAVPSIIAINKNINKRLYESKKELINSSAEMYANNNPDIFNGRTEVKVTVGELISKGYIEADVENGEGNCSDASGCMINPTNKESMNEKWVIIIKEAVGVRVVEEGESCIESNDPNVQDRCATGTIVEQVCEKFKNGRFIGKYGTGQNEYCACKSVSGVLKLFAATINAEGKIVNVSNSEVDACIITGDETENYLEYDNVLFRVVGLYKLNKGTSDEKIVAKMITNDTIDSN